MNEGITFDYHLTNASITWYLNGKHLKTIHYKSIKEHHEVLGYMKKKYKEYECNYK